MQFFCNHRLFSKVGPPSHCQEACNQADPWRYTDTLLALLAGTGTKRGAFYWQHEVGTVKDGHWDGKIGGGDKFDLLGMLTFEYSQVLDQDNQITPPSLLPLVKLKQGNLIQLKLTCWQGQQERTPDFRETPHFNWKFKVWLGGFNAPDEDILPTHRICLLSNKQVVTLS